MTRRVRRRSQEELLIHKWWFNGILALVLLIVASFLASYAHNSDSLVAYILAILLVAGGIKRALVGVRDVSDL